MTNEYNHFSHLDRGNLKPTPKHIQSFNELICYLVKEGNKLLELEEKQKAKLKDYKDIDFSPIKPKQEIKINNSNPYLRARQEILNNLDKAQRDLILSLETVNQEHRAYVEFSKEVQKLGDKYSNEK